MENFHNGQVVYHSAFGAGRIVNIEDERIAVNFIKSGVKVFSRSDAEDELSDSAFETESADKTKDSDEIRDAFRAVLYEENLIGTTPIASKWNGGEMMLKPGRPDFQGKSIPIDTFFHKIVMVRNQLRMLEQNINSSKSLTDREKVDIQQYITRAYGSLTTFNVLFADKNDWFVGARGE